jgi:hypothetical protein
MTEKDDNKNNTEKKELVIPESIKESLTGIVQIIPVMETNPKGTRYFFNFFVFGGIIYCISLWIQKPTVSEVKIPIQNVNGEIKKINPTADGNGFEIDTNTDKDLKSTE